MLEKIAEKVSRGPYLAWVCSVLYGCLLSILWMLFTEPLSKSYRLNQYSVWSTWTYLDLLTDNHQVLFILLSCLATELRLSITLFGTGFQRKKNADLFAPQASASRVVSKSDNLCRHLPKMFWKVLMKIQPKKSNFKSTRG